MERRRHLGGDEVAAAALRRDDDGPLGPAWGQQAGGRRRRGDGELAPDSAGAARAPRQGRAETAEAEETMGGAHAGAAACITELSGGAARVCVVTCDERRRLILLLTFFVWV